MKDKDYAPIIESWDTANIKTIDMNHVIEMIEFMERRIVELQEKMDIIEKILFKDKK